MRADISANRRILELDKQIKLKGFRALQTD